MSFRLDDLNSVGESYTENYFRQLVVAIEATPVFLGGLGQLEDHGERGLVKLNSTCIGSTSRDIKRLRDEMDDAKRKLKLLGRSLWAGRTRPIAGWRRLKRALEMLASPEHHLLTLAAAAAVMRHGRGWRVSGEGLSTCSIFLRGV